MSMEINNANIVQSQTQQRLAPWLTNADTLSFHDAVGRLLGFHELPPNASSVCVPDERQIADLCDAASRHASTLTQTFGLTHDECCAVVVCTMEKSYPPLFHLLNAWMNYNYRDAEVTHYVGPFTALLIRALLKLPLVTGAASRTIKVSGLPLEEDIFTNPKKHFPEYETIHLWSFSPFCSDDDESSSDDEALQGNTILYKYAELTAVDVSPFSILQSPHPPPSHRSMLLPIPPSTFQVQSHTKFKNILFVSVEHVINQSTLAGEPPPAAPEDQSRSELAFRICLYCGKPCWAAVGLLQWCRDCRWLEPHGTEADSVVWESTSQYALNTSTEYELMTSLVVLPKTVDADYLDSVTMCNPYHLVCPCTTVPQGIKWTRLRTLVVYYPPGGITWGGVPLFSEANRGTLGRLSSLCVICVNRLTMSAFDIALISGLKSSLRSLAIEAGPLTDAVVTQFASLKQLEALDLRSCRHVNQRLISAEIASLEMQVPDVRRALRNMTRVDEQRLDQLIYRQSLQSKSANQITDDGIRQVTEGCLAQQLHTLVLTQCDTITDTGLAHLKNLVRLQALNVECCSKITDAGVACLSRMAQLRALIFRSCEKITDAGVAHLRDLPQLHTLVLRGCAEITDDGVRHLKGLTQLQTLVLSCCNRITDAGMAHLSGLKQLRLLDLCSCDKITDDGVAHLRGLAELRALDLTDCYLITDDGVAHLKGLTKLQRLSLDSCDVTDVGVGYLKGLVHLQDLDLADCYRITDAGVAHLKGLTKLQRLSLDSCDVTDVGIAHLKGLVQLCALDLTDCESITDTGIAHVSCLEKLQKLGLSFCNNITDAGVAHLQSLGQLLELDLAHCDKITDKCIAHLKCLVRLQKLSLTSCDKITGAGVASLKASFWHRQCDITIITRREAERPMNTPHLVVQWEPRIG